MLKSYCNFATKSSHNIRAWHDLNLLVVWSFYWNPFPIQGERAILLGIVTDHKYSYLNSCKLSHSPISEEELQPTASEEPTCPLFLSLCQKATNLSNSPSRGEFTGFTGIWTSGLPPDPLRYLGAWRFSRALLTSGKITWPSVSKNPLVSSGRPVTKCSSFPAAFTTCFNQYPWLVGDTGSWDSKAWVKT